MIAAYAAATGDRTASVLDGLAVPAVFPVILVFTPNEAARGDLPESIWQHVRGGVHGAHDIVLHRPLVPGEPLETWSHISAVRTSRAGTQVVMRFDQVDADGAVAVEQWWTMVLLGLQGVADLGSTPADHRFPDDARARPVGSVTHHIDEDVARRYAEVSGDWSAHHFDIAVARAAGFDFVFTHGLCTMAICTHRLLGTAGRRRPGPGSAGRGAVRIADSAGFRPDGECLWHRRAFVRLRGRRQRHDDHHPRKIGTAAMSKPEIGVYLPQMGFTYEQVLHRTLRCEQLGIDSVWLYDHLYAPGMPDYPSLEAWTLATALLSRTERIQIGHMVLCNQFRHPAVLAKMATTLDQISAGRLQLGIGSGSIEDEHSRLGLDWGTFAERSERLGETLQILHQAFANEVIDFTGRHFTVKDMPIKPGPVQQPRPPIVVGGVGEKYTLPLVARYADVWNVPTYALGELEHKISVLRSICDEVGRDPSTIVLSIEAVMALAADDASLPAVRQLAEKRFGVPAFGLEEGGLIGTPPAIVDRLHELQGLGFGQIVLFTHDRGSDETLDLLASEVIAKL